MPFVDPTALTIRPQKILVAGTSGAGKTTLAGRIGQLLEIEHTEMDSLFHGPDWTPLESFETEVRRFSSEPAWVAEWQYGAVRGLLAERADLMLWLDLPRRTVMRQVITRTVRRRLRREVLWSGNIEPPLHTVLFERDHIVRWAWRTDRRNAERMATVLVDVPSLPIVRLGSRQEIEAVLEVLACLPSDRLS
ncbi:AAA family ATPase [Rhodococcus sp. NPDC056743]|uniref:AAA family ATPase n=1 Tax=Rhodococcus sp. NPDC056743 TaxID=3345934 RepID=UPI00366C91E6